jgi:hypothetical protein
MLALIQGTASDRKLRLLTVASCRQIWHLLLARSRTAAEVLERYADGLVGTVEYREAWSQADIESRMCAQDPPDATNYAIESVMISSPPTTTSVESALSTAAMAFGCSAALSAAEQDYDTEVEAGRQQAAERQAQLVRCVFGNPFRPVSAEPSWLTSTVLALAEGIYKEAAFDRLPILSDALLDAGCDNHDILTHCRSDGQHVRGCWVVDLLLEKE